VATLTLISSAALGPEINAAFIDGFVRAARGESFYPLARARHRSSGSSRAKDFCGDSIVRMCKTEFARRALAGKGMRCTRSVEGVDLYKQRRIPPRRLGSASSILDDAATRFLQIVDCGAALPVRSTPDPRRQALPLARATG
jgi:hypothetical protein